MPAEHQVRDGYRVVWDIGWWLDYAYYQEAWQLYCALADRPAFQDEPFRPRIVAIRDGELDPDAVFPDWPVR